MNTKRLTILSGLILVVLLLVGCGGGQAAEPVAVAPTSAPLTETAIPPTDTPIPPTDTPVPPTETPVPPTETPEPTATPSGLISDPPGISPSPRGYVSLVYDSESDRIVLVGGQTGNIVEDPSAASGATWIYDVTANTWTQMDPPAATSRRAAYGIAYDSESDRVILFGGGKGSAWEMNDTWAYDTNTNTWTRMSDGPRGRLGPRLAYDSESDRVILFGGSSSRDTWAYDFNSDTWTKMQPINRPKETNFQGLTYDVESDRVIMFRGCDDNSKFDDSVWAYDYNPDSWEELVPGEGPWPPSREYAVLTYDTESDRVILFGGIGDSLAESNKTWAYDYNTNTWTQMQLGGNPGAVPKQGMTYSEAADRVILFGGQRGGKDFKFTDKTWSYDFNSDTWENVTPQE